LQFIFASCSISIIDERFRQKGAKDFMNKEEALSCAGDYSKCCGEIVYVVLISNKYKIMFSDQYVEGEIIECFYGGEPVP
jgi:hypothetical protein